MNRRMTNTDKFMKYVELWQADCKEEIKTQNLEINDKHSQELLEECEIAADTLADLCEYIREYGKEIHEKIPELSKKLEKTLEKMIINLHECRNNY